MPFPTFQGTQAAVGTMLDVLVQRGKEPVFLSYSHGESSELPPAFQHYRLSAGYGDRSLRSGPSLAKLAQDAELVAAIARHRADVVVAHHVEAAGAALAARLLHPHRIVFVAHTALGPELPMYLPDSATWLGPLARCLGTAMDRSLMQACDRTLAVSPALAKALGALWLPLPWPLPPAVDAGARDTARRELRAELGLTARAPLLLYPGNLDRYQGLHVVSKALELECRPQLLVATASAFGDLLESLAPSLHTRVHFRRLDGSESQRAKLHAGSDAVVVPRASPGGIPIKLLDALARGTPVVATRRATADLPEIAAVVERVRDDDPVAFAEGIGRLLKNGSSNDDSETRREWVRRHCESQAFVDVLDSTIAAALSS